MKKKVIAVSVAAIVVIACIVVLISAYRKSINEKQITLFKEKVYMGYYTSSILADNIASVINDYYSGAMYYNREHGTMEYNNGEYCNNEQDAVYLVLEQYAELKVPDAIETYMKAAHDILPDNDETLTKLYNIAINLQKLATNPTDLFTYKDNVNAIKSDFTYVLDESDIEFPNTKINMDGKREEALRFIRVLGEI